MNTMNRNTMDCTSLACCRVNNVRSSPRASNIGRTINRVTIERTRHREGKKLSTKWDTNAVRSFSVVRSTANGVSGSTPPAAKRGENRQLSVIKRRLSYFLPMCLLFFFMAFNNTIFDSTKDTLLITAIGGAEQIPFVTLYAVLPCSCIFLFIFTIASSKFSRKRIFTCTVAFFMTFFWTFANFLYPNRHSLHSSALADRLSLILPVGLQGLGNMAYQWTFTLFYVMSELWGDVILSLNFWMLANDTTKVEDAVVLYPLFGLGANVAQFVSGQLLRNVTQLSGRVAYQAQLQYMVNMTLITAFLIWGLYYWIATKFVKEPSTEEQEKMVKVQEESDGEKKTFSQSLKTLLGSSKLQCLAAIALAQGISTNLVEVAWKANIRQRYPDPASYSAFMGGVSSTLGVFTAAAMILSPSIFLRWKWKQAASVNPNIMLYGGTLFFLAAIACKEFAFKGQVIQLVIILAGTALYVFGRASKFSLLKPAEEMIYITLDDDSRRSGKAAIEVVGSQVGKSLSSIMQQLFLIFGGGVIQQTYPMMVILLVTVGTIWMKAVNRLSWLVFEKGSNKEDPDVNASVNEMADKKAPLEVDSTSGGV